MEMTGELYNLLEIDKNHKVWAVLSKMVVRGWNASELFKKIKNGQIREGEYVLYLLSCDGEPAAWGMHLKRYEDSELQLWIYTKPKFRKQGLQKNHIIPYWNNKSKLVYSVQTANKQQRESFKYVKERTCYNYGISYL